MAAETSAENASPGLVPQDMDEAGGCFQPHSAPCTARAQQQLWHSLFFSKKQNLSVLAIIILVIIAALLALPVPKYILKWLQLLAEFVTFVS